MVIVQSSITKSRKTSTKTPLVWRFGLVAFILLTILSPNITIRAGLYSPRGEDLILVALIGILFFSLPLKRGKSLFDYSHENKTITNIMIGMFYISMLSIGIGTLAFQQRLVFSDFMILPMIVRYWFILQIGLWAGQKSERPIFIWALAIGLGISALVGILQYFNLIGINDWLTPLYVGDGRLRTGLDLVKLQAEGARVVGTSGDPRHYAYILVIGVGLSIAMLSALQKRILNILSLILLLLSIAAILTTASRTAVISGAVIILFSIILLVRASRGAKKIITLFIFLAIVFALLFPTFEDSTFESRVLNTNSVSTEISYRARVRDLIQPFNRALEDPIIFLSGRGPSKAELRTNSHNDFGWYFYRFGLVGLLLYLSLFWYGRKFSMQTWHFAKAPAAKLIGMLAFFGVINWFVFAMAENIFKDPQLMSLNMLLIGICIGVLREQRLDSTVNTT